MTGTAVCVGLIVAGWGDAHVATIRYLLLALIVFAAVALEALSVEWVVAIALGASAIALPTADLHRTSRR